MQVCVCVCVGQGVVVECIRRGRMWGLVVTSVVLSVVLYYWVRFKVLQSVHYHVVRSINLQLFVDKKCRPFLEIGEKDCT